MEHIVHILPPTSLTFTGVGNSQSVAILIAQRIPTFGAHEAVLIARLHGGTNISIANQTLAFNLMVDGFTMNDPAVGYTSALNAAAGVTYTGIVNTIQMKYVASSIAIGAGGSFSENVAVQIVATQPAAGGTFLATPSIDLVFKGGRGQGQHETGHFLGYR